MTRTKFQEKFCVNCGSTFMTSTGRIFCNSACKGEKLIALPRTNNRDKNEKEISDILRSHGATVIELQGSRLAGLPDLLVGYNNITYLIEIKNPGTDYGKSGLTRKQYSFFVDWKGGPCNVVYSSKDALILIGAKDNLGALPPIP